MIRKLYSVGDSQVRNWSPDRNYGAVPNTYIQTYNLPDDEYGVIKFYYPPDLQQYDIISVKFFVYFDQASNALYVRFHKILSDWVEGNGTYGGDSNIPNSITYNNAPRIDTAYTERYISSVQSGGQWVDTLMTNDLNLLPQYGWAIKHRPNVSKWFGFNTREYGLSRTPYLEIVYKLKTPTLSATVERVKDGFKLSWVRQQINYYKPSSYRIFKYNPNVNEYILIKPTPSSTATVNGDTFEYIDREIVDYDYDYKYAIQARYHDEGTEKLTPFIFLDAGTLYKTESPQIEMAAVGGHTAMRHLINTKHSVHLDELNKIELSTWKKSLDATSISNDVDLRLTGDGNTFTKNILPIEDSNLGNIDNRWLEIHAEELKTDVSKTAKLRLWNGR